MNKYIIRVLSIILGVLFLISGGVKEIDPFGGALKIEEYLLLLQFDFIGEFSILLSILLSSFEMLIGLFFIFGLHKRITIIVTLSLIVGFTLLSIYLAFSPYVAIQECGCFGDAIKLSNYQTFWKNIIILLLVIIYAILLFRQKVVPQRDKIILPIYLLIFTLITPLYSVYSLPPFDFLSYNRGENILQNRRLNIYDKKYNDVTDSLLMNSNKPQLLIIAHKKIDKQKLSKLSAIIESNSNIFNCVILSSVEQSDIIGLQQYYVDEVTAKEMIRSESGIMLIDKGIIKDKWNLTTVKNTSLNKQYNRELYYWLLIFIGGVISILLKIYIK